MTPEDKKIWEEVARTIKPVKKKKKASFGVAPAPLSTPKSNPSDGSRQEKVSLETFAFPQKDNPLFQPTIMEGQDRLIARKLRKGSYTIQATLDLHGQTQEEAYDSLQRFIRWALQQKLKLVLIITGKGVRTQSFSEMKNKEETPVGVLRQKVPQWLENTAQFPGVLSVSTARPEDGGKGALYVELRSYSESR